MSSLLLLKERKEKVKYYFFTMLYTRYRNYNILKDLAQWLSVKYIP